MYDLILQVISPILRCDRFSVLPAMSLSGILLTHVVEGSFNMELFNEFIEELLDEMEDWDAETQPADSVLVLDNCKIHKDPGLVEMVERR